MTLTPEQLAEARHALSKLGGEAKARAVVALKEAAATGDISAQKKLQKMARIARRNGRKGGRPRSKP